MADDGISTAEFKKLVNQEVRDVCTELGYNYDSEKQRGFAFQYWCARLIKRAEPSFDTDADDAVVQRRDLKADIVFEDTSANHMCIGQSKMIAWGAPVDESEVVDFFSRHQLYSDRDWVKKHGSEAAASALADYGERMKVSWSVAYYFLTTGTASSRVCEAVASMQQEAIRRTLNIRYSLLDLGRLKDYYLQAESLDQSPPKEVTLHLPMGRFFSMQTPRPTVVVALKGNVLRSLAKGKHQSVFSWNIRGYLGSRGINAQIAETATSTPDDFFYFNNGVSAICTDFAFVNKNEIRIWDLQIINGAQTVNSLAEAPENSAIEVLFRLTKTEDVKTEKGFNQRVIQYNNSQNVVKLSDFRSNDRIQHFLESAIWDATPRGPLQKVQYLPKRTVKRRKGAAVAITLEDFAKVRYSFLEEPTLVHEAPKSLWSEKETGGVYETVFGVEGVLEPKWSQDTLDEALLALAFHFHIEKTVKLQDDVNRYMRRLRFHAVGLAGEYYRRVLRLEGGAKTFLTEAKFAPRWRELWDHAFDILESEWSSAESEKMTMFAFVRNTDRWENMKRRLTRKLAKR